MLNAFKFSKPKGPGFGISKRFYISILSTKAVLPPLVSILNPEGEDGAVVGLGAPLMPGATKDMLREPLARGAYALATKDRKTVVKLLVLSAEEAGFDAETLARSSMAASLDPEILARIRATWTIAQATFESHDPQVYPSILFLLGLAKRLSLLTDGAIADPISQRYLLPEDILRTGTSETSVDVLDVVSYSTADRPDGMHAFTLGLQKFALPELEITGLAPDTRRLAGDFLLSAAQTILRGMVLTPGAKLGSNSALFEAQEGGHDRALWEGIQVLELLAPTHMTATDALEIWHREQLGA